MAKPWAEVAKSDGYRALSSAEREEARNEYWREVVAPRVPVAELMGVRQAFDADTAPGLVKRQLSPPSLPAAAACAGLSWVEPRFVGVNPKFGSSCLALGWRRRLLTR